jgi:cellulose synthase/poly-beta-1,6-N-acetylglucosamine synthase-like glycosyltransferase
MKKVINFFDLFSKPVNLYTQSYPSVITLVGFSFTVLLFPLLCIIFILNPMKYLLEKVLLCSHIDRI